MIEHIDAFWNWFKQNRSLLETALTRSDSDTLNRMLGHQISAISPAIGWEVGPGLSKEFALAFTLNGTLDNRKIAESATQRAPIISSWEFHAGRPKKSWDFHFELINNVGQTAQIDAREWRYTLTGYSNFAFFDIRLYAPNIPRLDDVAAMQAARTVIQGVLGEIEMLESIDRIEIHREATDDKSSSNIQVLLEHILHLRDIPRNDK